MEYESLGTRLAIVFFFRYCIIDQSKLPHYQHAYDNVDRDEDDEIDIAELDFALKTVNYNLITDAEMNYVHSVNRLMYSARIISIASILIGVGAGWKIQTQL